MKALQGFCDFMFNCYKDKKLHDELLAWPLMYQPKSSDMSIFQLYIHKYPERVFDLRRDHGDHIVYDWYINESEWYESIFWKKYFKIKWDRAYFYKSKEKIEAKTLHFQMHMKFYMWMIFYKQVWLFRILLFFTYIVERIYRRVPLVRKLRKKWKRYTLFK